MNLFLKKVTRKTCSPQNVALEQKKKKKKQQQQQQKKKKNQNTAKLMSLSIQMISDKMQFDTIALRQKNAIWKVDDYNIISVYVQCNLEGLADGRTEGTQVILKRRHTITSSLPLLNMMNVSIYEPPFWIVLNEIEINIQNTFFRNIS